MNGINLLRAVLQWWIASAWTKLLQNRTKGGIPEGLCHKLEQAPQYERMGQQVLFAPCYNTQSGHACYTALGKSFQGPGTGQPVPRPKSLGYSWAVF